MANWALIVGINLHPSDAGLSDLHGAVADAADFAEWALDPNGGTVAKDRLFIWTTPAPKPEDIGPLLEDYLRSPTPWPLPRLFARAKVPDLTRPPMSGEIGRVARAMAEGAVTSGQTNRAYVHFAGHGAQITEKGVRDTCFLAGDYATGGGLVPCAQLSTYLHTNGFAEVAMFLDCCRTAISLEAMPNLFVAGQFPGRTKSTGHAAEPDKMSFEFPLAAPARGAFTSAVTDGLRTHREADGQLTFDGLGTYVRQKVDLLLGARMQSPQFANDPPQPNPPLVLAAGAAAPVMQPIVVTFVKAAAGQAVWLVVDGGPPQGPLTAGPEPQSIEAAIGRPYALRTADFSIIVPFSHPGPGPTHVSI